MYSSELINSFSFKVIVKELLLDTRCPKLRAPSFCASFAAAGVMDDSAYSQPLADGFAGPPLLPQIAAGDISAVDRFVERYGGLIWSLARRMTRTSHDAEDVVQEIFIDLWKNASSFQPDRGTEVTFVSIIARRRLIDRIRKQAATVQVMELTDHTVMQTVASSLNSLEIADELSKVRSCMEQLTTHAQSVLKLILHEGMSHQEVSTSLCMPLGSVKSFARRGLLALRDCVKRPLTSSLQEAQS